MTQKVSSTVPTLDRQALQRDIVRLSSVVRVKKNLPHHMRNHNHKMGGTRGYANFSLVWGENHSPHERTASIGSCIWILGPQLVILFGKVMGSLCGRALQVEGCHLSKTLREYSLALLPVLSFCFLCMDGMWLPSPSPCLCDFSTVSVTVVLLRGDIMTKATYREETSI